MGTARQDGLVMRRAKAGDADAVLGILEDGIAAIARLGIEQWQHGYPNMEAVRADIAAGRSWLCEDAAPGEPRGTLALSLDYEADYDSPTERWLTPEDPADPAYAVIHRTAVAAGAARRGVMSYLFCGAEEEARRAGRRSLRIDTHPGNVRMRALCEKLGFTCCGEHELTPHGDEVDRVRLGYEKLI